MHLRVTAASMAGLAAVLLLALSVDAEAARRKPRIKGAGETLALKAFVKKHGLADNQMSGMLSGVGRIRCAWGVGTAFLLAGADVVVTSAHIFTELEPKSKLQGKRRGNARSCAYYPLLGKGRYRIAAGSLIEGPRAQKRGYEFYWTDWAVGRLEKPVKGATPLMPGPLDIKAGGPAFVISQGMNDSITRLCSGSIESVEKHRDIIGFTSTCDTGPGASGGPVLGTGPGEALEGKLPVVGLTLGWVGGPSSEARHFALPLEIDLMSAVARTLGDPAKVLELAGFYREASGPPAQMLEISRALYRVAAERGAPEAYFWLGQLYSDVLQILPNDEAEAYGWLELAVRALPEGDARASEAASRLKELSGRLDAAQMEAGRERVKSAAAGGAQSEGKN